MPEAEQHLRSFRITTDAALMPAVEALLEAEGYRFEPEPFSPLCRRLVAEPAPLGGSLAAFFGLVYIQDRSSMLPPLALAPAPGSCVLDLCASPGSKTGFLAQLVGPSGFVLANEVSHSRLFTLRANMQACNFLQVGTCSFEGQSIPLPPASLDAIQLDPPCSGWGTVEKNPRVMALWHDDKVKPLVGLQRLLLAGAARLLRPGGVVVYSTCTTNEEEDEHQVRYAEEELGLVREDLAPFAGFAWEERPGGQGTLRVDGRRSHAQGFYVARLRRPAAAGDVAGPGPSAAAQGQAAPQRPLRGSRKKARPAQTAGMPVARENLSCASVDAARLPEGRCAVFSGIVRFLPAHSARLLPESFVWQGFPLGRMGPGGFQPDARLRALVPEHGPRLACGSVEEVRGLLGGRLVPAPADLAGEREAVLCWRDLPLGRVAIRGGRVIAAFR